MSIAKIIQAASFATIRHRNQKRKNSIKSPYIEHPMQVAEILTQIGLVEDADVIIGALLHDTVEDTGTTIEEIAIRFGVRVASLVAELSDDKSLPKPVRKQLQIDNSKHKSLGAKQIGICDKICNIRDLAYSPPTDWSVERMREYIDWSDKVVEGYKGCNAALEGYYYQVVTQTRLALDTMHVAQDTNTDIKDRKV